MTATDGPADPAIPVRRVAPAYEQVAAQLRELILEGRLRPGDRLPSETRLTEMFGVSRGTVREALRALASRDLVVTTRGTTGGTFVARTESGRVSDYLEASIGLMSADGLTVAEIIEARELLEIPAAGLAATRRTEEHVARLHEVLASEERLQGRHGTFTEHRQFHALVLEAAGNRLLAMVAQPIYGVLQGRFTRPDPAAQVWDEVEGDHELIADRIVAGDVADAEAAMREHLERLRGVYGEVPATAVERGRS